MCTRSTGIPMYFLSNLKLEKPCSKPVVEPAAESPAGLVKTSMAGPLPSGSDSVGLRGLKICMSDKFSADTDAADLGIHSGL